MDACGTKTVTLGYGRFFNNDALGDGKDRWRTGSYTVSIVRGTDWDGDLPNRFGAVLEYRARSEIIAPANLAAPSPNDRRYVGALSVGVHSYFKRNAVEMRLGADLVAVGPQTGVGALQRKAHKLFGMGGTSDLSGQLSNHVYPTMSAEMGKTYTLGAARLRPFAEAQVGVETYVRLGGDLTIGHFGQGALMLRDQVTGQRFTGTRGDAGQGASFTVGGDIARIFDSAYLPDGGSVESIKRRSRLRAGVNWRGEKSEVFYGVTHLGREFDRQPSGQTVGSLRLHIRF
ncbi:lipid A-modifier LpxR family protein [Pseudorhodobacter ferrugineus]|uniref:lipid A-modifier LpxR family protein n=1 Tax=Pseudorhodobacter ferrugineus TaxID=77008 RepID=UPI0009E3773A|nr:lipid A-modifier LpxR family protein [Pseudorhodobacter ferrugineus]